MKRWRREEEGHNAVIFSLFLPSNARAQTRYFLNESLYLTAPYFAGEVIDTQPRPRNKLDTFPQRFCHPPLPLLSPPIYLTSPSPSPYPWSTRTDPRPINNSILPILLSHPGFLSYPARPHSLLLYPFLLLSYYVFRPLL